MRKEMRRSVWFKRTPLLFLIPVSIMGFVITISEPIVIFSMMYVTVWFHENDLDILALPLMVSIPIVIVAILVVSYRHSSPDKAYRSGAGTLGR